MFCWIDYENLLYFSDKMKEELDLSLLEQWMKDVGLVILNMDDWLLVQRGSFDFNLEGEPHHSLQLLINHPCAGLSGDFHQIVSNMIYCFKALLHCICIGQHLATVLELWGGAECWGSAAEEADRWRRVIESGSMIGQEITRLWTALRLEATQAALWLDAEVPKALACETVGIG